MDILPPLKGASSTQTTSIGGLNQTPNLNQDKEVLPTPTEKGPTARAESEAQLKVVDQLGGPWIAIGDYNAVTDMDDRQFGNHVHENEVQDFNAYIIESGMTELRAVGRKFTWSNGKICSRIERAFVNAEWFLTIAQTEVAAWDIPMKYQCMEVLWRKLKEVKTGLKQLNQVEYSNVEKRMQLYRQKLADIQAMITNHNHPVELFIAEKELQKELEKWQSQNRIRFLINANGETLQQPKEIEKEVTRFYKNLLGTTADQLPAIDPTIMRRGNYLNRGQQLSLIAPINKEEVYQSLMSIDDQKAPGYDGFNVLLFKRAWPIIGEEVTNVVLQYFEDSELYKAINFTITLIPKVQNPSKISEFRSISYCTMLYKLISKVLTRRMQGVMDSLVDQSQSVFVPRRLITDNIILSHELVKGYGRKGITPRCMLKIDMRKVYDYIEWQYIKQILNYLQFPTCFVKCILRCVQSVSYSIILNGNLVTPFQAKKGLRQGDPLSLLLFVLVMEYLNRSLKGLNAMPSFKFHLRCKKLQIIQLGFANDLLLFCKGELESVFVLPKKVIQLVETTCRNILWTGGSDTSKKALIAWERLCQPRVAGGLNILNVYTWNQAAIGKLLWNVCRKKDNLWVKWIYTYYTKGGSIWGTKIVHASWMVQKIFKAKVVFEQASLTEDAVAKMSTYSIKKIYGLIRGEYPKIPWRRLLCNNAGVPKWLFILFMALHRRLQTQERIACWANLEDMICPLCLRKNEDIDHMLFQCDYAKEIWNKLLQWQDVRRGAGDWQTEVLWAIRYATGKKAHQETYRMVLAGGVYHIWQERNARIFKMQRRAAHQMICGVNRGYFGGASLGPMSKLHTFNFVDTTVYISKW
ncbi:uncharacterized protein [Nicotiana tomentosiformis]|uniref:uncharacterized protein n=1 Tax=Nicotiana tomentosiformis TaxID=4098 RepID=UPI00388CD197